MGCPTGAAGSLEKRLGCDGIGISVDGVELLDLGGPAYMSIFTQPCPNLLKLVYLEQVWPSSFETEV